MQDKVCLSLVGETDDLNQSESRRRSLYAAFASKDARFDGQVFVGVSSTGIYCRPVCPYKPKFENCTFYATAAECEKAGYRPCLVCRPETAPGKSLADASSDLARRAAILLREECSSGDGLERLAERLGYTDRHLRRVFEEEFHVTPLQYLQTCRLQLAEQLLADTDLPVAQVAKAAGFGSVRRFNDVFKRRYRLTPSDLRKRGKRDAAPEGTFMVKLGYRTPYRFDQLLDFFRVRQLEGVEAVGEGSYARSVRISLDDGGEATGWVRVEDDAAHRALKVTMSESLLPVTSQVVGRLRRQFDTESDPYAIGEVLTSIDATVPGAFVLGTRLPGAFDGFETTVRAVLGQQVTLAAANKLAARVVQTFGTPIETPFKEITRLFPRAGEIATLDNIEEQLGVLGVIKTRSRSIAELAGLIASGELAFESLEPMADRIERLCSVRGIGPWTANYIAMRTMGHTDAFLETDAGIKHALPDLSPAERAALAEQWSPWRSYAVMSLWNSLS